MALLLIILSRFLKRLLTRGGKVALPTLKMLAPWVQTTVEDLNQDQKERVRPLKQEAIRLRAGLDSLEREIDRLVRGVGWGIVSVQRLEQEIFRHLQDLRKVFAALLPKEQCEVLRCLVRDIVV